MRDTRCESRTGTHRLSRPPQLIALPSHFLMMRSERELGRLRHEEAILALPAALPHYNYFHGMCSVYFGHSLLLLPCVELILQLIGFLPFSSPQATSLLQCPSDYKNIVRYMYARDLNITQSRLFYKLLLVVRRILGSVLYNLFSLSKEAQNWFFSTSSH